MGVGIREMAADVPQARRPQQGIGYRVEQHIRVGMAQQALLILDFHTAQDQVTPLHQPVYVISVSDSHFVSSNSSSAIFKSRGVVTFRFRSSPSTILIFMPSRSTAEQSSVT